MLHTALPADLIDRLPTPKGVALALTKACRRDDMNLEEIAKLVRTDPALTARLLALANAAASGGRAVVSVDEAVARMGLLRVSQVALAFSLIDQHGAGNCINFDYAGFWNRSLLMAACAREFGSLSKLGVPADLFTVGLLAQIGRLGLATAFPKEYSNLMVLDITSADLRHREVALMKTDHVDLSVALMEHWGIPIEYARPFGLHEDDNHGLFAPQSVALARAVLAHTCWKVSVVLSVQDSDALLDDADCMAALQWLDLAPEQLSAKIEDIEATWRIWLNLISRAG
jgi:HD-like signal output (HDOD) protein